MRGGVRCLKSSTHDDGVVLEVPLGVLRSVRSEYGKQIRKKYEAGELKISRHSFLEKEIRSDGVVNTLDSVQKDNLLAVKVKEATKTGYAVARGGARFRQLLDAGKQDKKRKSRGRYGKYIGHKLQSGDICSNLRRTHSICGLVSGCNPKADTERVFQTARMDRRLL